MPVLTNPRHERFAQELARGEVQVRAYELAGYRPDTGAASRLSADVSVASRVRELTARAAEKAVLTKAWVIERLMKNAERALQERAVRDAEGRETGEYEYEGQVANRALELLGKELGMFVDRSEVNQTVRDITDEPITPDAWAERHVTAH